MTDEEFGRIIPLFGDLGAGERAEFPSCPVERPTPDDELTRRLIELVVSIGGGDRAAFTELYRLTSHRVFGLALRMLGNRATAEEVTQEVYLQIWVLAGRYDATISSPIGWLMMLAHRRAVDRIRIDRSSTHREIAFGHLHLGQDRDVVLEEVEQIQDEQAVSQCLDALTALQRETIALAYYGGRTYTEVAEHLGTPVPTVKSRIRDGLKRLADCLLGSGPK
ncbi:sigma-70 family RNA polymerase sigma factor [Nocardia sp. NPDC059240]|uniref:sigma-70 family RNA polymerase sigma factor n=1 Tax=Nocardia sp. NPDC059240 TaxID=3346786 RepID=UPI0036C62087